MSIVVTPYNPTWPQAFEAYKSYLETHLSNTPIISIEHVGSTSVPGLAAKPFIDIDIIVSRADLPTVLEVLTKNTNLFYLGELGIADRHAMYGPERIDEPRCNIYVCVDGSVALWNHISLRDTLRKNEGLREEYARVKMELASRPGITIDEYIEGKSAVIQKILRAGGVLGEEELAELKRANIGGRVPKIETERLVLREYVMEDVDAYFALESKGEVVRYQDYGPVTQEKAMNNVANVIRKSFVVPREVVELAVTHGGRFIGRVGAKIATGGNEEEMKQVSLWYSLEPEFQGKGLGTEAVEAFLPVLGRPALLEIECDPRNTGSVNMAKRLGFSLVSLKEAAYECKGEWVGSAVYWKMV